MVFFSYICMHKLLTLPKPSAKQTWQQLHGSSLMLAIVEYAKTYPGVYLCLAPDNQTALRLYDELPFFLDKDCPIESLFFPDWETLPYDTFSPHQDIISTRLTTLNRLQLAKNAIVITSVSTLMHRLCPPQFLTRFSCMLRLNQTLNIQDFRLNLTNAGYFHVENVLEHGEYALRGAIIDVFPMGSAYPFRIELFDDEIDSLRQFDPETQRTINKLQQINILPAREFPLDEAGIALFRQQYRTMFPGNPTQSVLYEAISQQQLPNGIEYYLPLFFEQTATLLDYLPPAATVYAIENIHDKSTQFWQEIMQRFEQKRYDITRPLLTPETLFLNSTELFTKLQHFNQIHVYAKNSVSKAYTCAIHEAPALPIEHKSSAPLKALKHYLTSTARFIIVVESIGRREVVSDLLKSHGIRVTFQDDWAACMRSESAINMVVGLLTWGFELVEPDIKVIVEAQLFKHHVTQSARFKQKAMNPDLVIRDLAELQLHAPVVHLQFGVGRYEGLQTIDNQGVANEFLILSYAGNDKIYVPVTALHQISRYTGSNSDHAPLHKLGTDTWQKERKKAEEKIHDTAIELLEIYAKREAQKGEAYQIIEQDYLDFAASFPFDETEDQLKAIEAIKQDLQAPRPMDRLICGDVGFGKTEVAMRAAFLAVQNNKQVCILVPTTLLAGQHFENFQDRFAEFPITVDFLSRFRTAKETKQVLEKLAQGTVDIVIGTHKLFASPITFKNLGLLIIDEEHRFGVKQKEHLKALRLNVDILSMTATPIPRTLNMALAGIRDISIIATPPAKRLAIKTFWQQRQDNIIREALLREILRGGQVFFLHNNVQTIARIAEDLQALVPEAKISVAHGQMRERELEKIMSDFYHQRFNILVCTTIIETGIDIPTANTIIIDRADTFGLAQLHQLRGRVGRSHHQAYAYLLTPDEKLLNRDAIKRLEAIVSLENLGAGFMLATHDMEIRGTGELLGEEQSGNIQAVGFSLFMEMLDKAVNDLKSGKTPELAAPIQDSVHIELNVSAILPEHYIGDIHTRLIMYKRIANAKHQTQLRDLQIEMIDRFGLLPDAAKNLLALTELKLLAIKIGVLKITATQQKGRIEFNQTPLINPATLIKLIQQQSTLYQLDGPSCLRFTLNQTGALAKIAEVNSLLEMLGQE